MPDLVVNTSLVRANTEVIARLLRHCDLELVAVTKGCLGDSQVAAAMMAGGAVALADSRDINLRRLREDLPGMELHRIHLPSLEQEFEPGDINYVSSWETAEVVGELDGAGPSKVMLLVDTGDQREGVPLDQATGLARRIAGHPGLELVGVATNYACLGGGDEGLRESVGVLAEAAQHMRDAGLPIDRVSGGSSSLFQTIPGCRRDACLIRAEVVEEYTRRAAEGPARRLLLGVGWQDLGSGTVEFTESGLREIERSSDYLVLGVEGGSRNIEVGQMVNMVPDYKALVAAWTSPYVETSIVGPRDMGSEN
jgi:predicted amino acid racemase